MAKKSQAAEIHEHLLEVFKYLTRSKPIGSYAKRLSTSCGIALAQLGTARPDSWDLVMQPCVLDIRGGTTRGQQDCIEIVIGAEAKAAGGRLTYQSVPLNIILGPRCFSHDPPWCAHPAATVSAVASRRVHFDYDVAVTKRPKHHLQIGGNAAELHQAGSYHYAVAEDPSEPRIPAPSLDFVLVLDLVMREFHTRLDLPQDPAWRKLVLRSQEIFLKPYFEDAHNHLQRKGTDLPPLIEHLSR